MRTFAAALAAFALAGPLFPPADAQVVGSGQNVVPVYEGWEQNADGTFKRSYTGVGRGMLVQTKDEGTWKLHDRRLVQTGKAEEVNWVLGVGADPKGGAFLVLSYGPKDTVVSLVSPRAPFQGVWYKRK